MSDRQYKIVWRNPHTMEDRQMSVISASSADEAIRMWKVNSAAPYPQHPDYHPRMISIDVVPAPVTEVQEWSLARLLAVVEAARDEVESWRDPNWIRRVRVSGLPTCRRSVPMPSGVADLPCGECPACRLITALLALDQPVPEPEQR